MRLTLLTDWLGELHNLELLFPFWWLGSLQPASGAAVISVTFPSHLYERIYLNATPFEFWSETLPSNAWPLQGMLLKIDPLVAALISAEHRNITVIIRKKATPLGAPSPAHLNPPDHY